MLGWPEIRAGRDVLISAPTGSGKTLAAFLICLDRLVRAARTGKLAERDRSRLRLAAEGAEQRRPQEPGSPAGGDFAACRASSGIALAPIRTAVRTGDTPAYERQQMGKAAAAHPGDDARVALHSLDGRKVARKCCARTRTVIVDEIHAVADDKRGSHLALSLARLDALLPIAASRSASGFRLQ